MGTEDIGCQVSGAETSQSQIIDCEENWFLQGASLFTEKRDGG